MKTLDARLLAAHARDDKEALVRLYAEAADAAPDAEAAAFYLTHAHVYALEVDHPDLLPLRQKLIDQGRELPLPAPAPRLG
ncbi:MAG: hypothetical protein AAF744_00045 [Pseudomonadota bacterium]